MWQTLSKIPDDATGRPVAAGQAVNPPRSQQQRPRGSLQASQTGPAGPTEAGRDPSAGRARPGSVQSARGLSPSSRELDTQTGGADAQAPTVRSTSSRDLGIPPLPPLPRGSNAVRERALALSRWSGEPELDPATAAQAQGPGAALDASSGGRSRKPSEPPPPPRSEIVGPPVGDWKASFRQRVELFRRPSGDPADMALPLSVRLPKNTPPHISHRPTRSQNHSHMRVMNCCLTAATCHRHLRETSR